MVDLRKIAVMMVLPVLLTGILALPAAAQVTSQSSISNTLSQYTDFTTLNKALNAAGLGGYLSGKGPYTLFAPTNSAFSQFTPGTLNALLGDQPKMADILQYHIVPGTLSISSLASTPSVRTIDGRSLPVSVQNGYLVVGGARVITRGISCSNGIIYPVDSVILPPAYSAPAGTPAAGPAFAPQQYTPQQPIGQPVSQPVSQPPAPRGGPGLLKTIGITLGVILLAIILVGIFLLWLFIRLLKGLFRGPSPRPRPVPAPGYTPPARGKDVYEPATFGNPAPGPGGTSTIRDEGPYLPGSGTATGPGIQAEAGAGGITFDESAVDELKRMDRGRLSGIHQYIVGSYNNFKDMLDLVRDARIDLTDIKDNSAVGRLMDRYHLSPFNSNTLELALEKNATIYTKDRTLLDIYRAAGAKAEDLRRLLAGS